MQQARMINVVKYASSYRLNMDGPAYGDARQWWNVENHVHKAGI